jgi:hypothetical protein
MTPEQNAVDPFRTVALQLEGAIERGHRSDGRAESPRKSMQGQRTAVPIR